MDPVTRRRVGSLARGHRWRCVSVLVARRQIDCVLCRRKVEEADLSGGVPQLLADANSGRGGTWGPDGVILFSPGGAGGLFRVPASGGDVVPVTKLDLSRHSSHRNPQFLPGRRFVFYALGNAQFGGLHAGSLDSTEIKRLTAADTTAAYMPSGWLFFVRHGTLTAQRLDVSRMELTDEPVRVADPLVVENSIGAFSVSASGLVAYRRSGGNRRQLVWFDRSGKTVGTLGGPDENGLSDPELSPDGGRVVANRYGGGQPGRLDHRRNTNNPSDV